NDQIVDTHFLELMSDPVAMLHRVYEQLGYASPRGHDRAIAGYLDAKPNAKHGVHTYSFGDLGLDETHVRATFAPYVAHYGSIKLTRTTTLAAYHNGVERYVTSFEFSGQGKSVGSIVPLPGVPTKVERGGSWTLQRLEREVAPPERFAFNAAKAAGSLDSAQ